jgi:hypothetical protein
VSKLAKEFMIRDFFKETNLAPNITFLRLFNVEVLGVLGDFKQYMVAYRDSVQIIRNDTKESTLLCG